MNRSGERRNGGGVLSSALAILLVLPLASPAETPPQELPEVPTLAQVRADWDAGRLDQALSRLDALPALDLDDHLALIRAQILRERGQLDAAIRAARAGLELEPASEVASILHAEMARIYLGRDEVLDAYKAQRAAWDATRNSEKAASLAMNLARSFETRARPGLALHLYRQIWSDWTLSDVSPDAYERAAELTAAIGAEPPSIQPLLERADRLRESHRCKQALESYENLLNRDDLEKEAREDVERGRAHCLFSRRRYGEAADAYRALAKRDPKDFDAAIRVARSYARGGKNDKAVREFEKIAKKSTGPVRARANYLAGIVQRTRNPSRFVQLMKRVEKQKSAPGLANLAGWRLTWEDLKHNRHKSALPRLARLSRGSIWDIEVQRGLYWHAVAQIGAEQKEQGEAGLRNLAAKLPLSYYGIMAADRLGEPPSVGESFVSSSKNNSENRHARRARLLLEAGFEELGALELYSWRSGSKLTREERISAARLMHGMGNHSDAVRMIINGFGGTLAQGIDPEWRDAWQMAWPRPFADPVRSAIAEFDFDTWLVYAIMREESTYRPRVSSSAGALGLMQIIPPTGIRIASRLGVPGWEPERLLEPKTSIRFGTYYLKSLVTQFKGSHAHAIASYNAGPEIVSAWLARDGRQANDAFVESVPYGETRRYLRRVLRSYRIYELLYGKGQLRTQTTAQPPSAVSR
ncbi:MAG: transglycosylase SLT domain-containing protein [bacterium]|nr:transglycosylase SLT domain-containing protein [bacterium]